MSVVPKLLAKPRLVGLFHFVALCGLLCSFGIAAEDNLADHSSKSSPTNRDKKVLLIFAADRKDEADTAVEACRKFGLVSESATSFDTNRADYSGIGTIIAGTNAMMYWSGDRANAAAFNAIDQFIRQGGHLIVFGSWNGDHLEHLAPYGIKTGYMHS